MYSAVYEVEDRDTALTLINTSHSRDNTHFKNTLFHLNLIAALRILETKI